MFSFPRAPSHVGWGAAGSLTHLCLSHRYAGVLLDEDVFHGKELVDSRPLQALVAGLKAYSTWENIRCLQDCRECTGGMVSPPRPQGVPDPQGPCVIARVGGAPCASAWSTGFGARRKPRRPP